MIYRSVGDCRYFDTRTKKWYRQTTLDEWAGTRFDPDLEAMLAKSAK